MGRDRHASSRFVVLADIDLSGQDYRQPVTRVANPDERLACTVRSEFAKPTQPLDFGRLPGGEHLLTARIRDLLGRRGHTRLRSKNEDWIRRIRRQSGRECRNALALATWPTSWSRSLLPGCRSFQP